MKLFFFLAVFLLSPLWCESNSLQGHEIKIVFSPELPTKIHVRNTEHDEVAIPIIKREKTDDFVVGLWYLFNTPDLMQIVLSFLDPALLTWCVEPDSVISKALTKQYKKELHRIGCAENLIQTNQFFSYENMMLLAMTNRVFNEAFREVQVIQENANFQLFKDYIRLVRFQYNIWREIYSSIDVHEQMMCSIPKFRGIPHENRLLRIARNNIRFSQTFRAIKINKEHLKERRWKFIFCWIGIAMTVLYADVYVEHLSASPAWVIFMMVLVFSIINVVAVVLGLLYQVHFICLAAIKTRKLLNKNEFVKIGDTISEQEKLVKSLLFLDNPYD